MQAQVDTPPSREDKVPAVLRARTVFAMPVGPPFGGMTAYTAMLRESSLFAGANAVLFDTTQPAGERNLLRRSLHSLGSMLRLLSVVRRHRAEVVYFMTPDFLGFYEKSIMALCCRALGAKTVLHPVGGFVNFYGGAGFARRLIRFLLEHVSAVITVEESMQDYVTGLAPRTPVWHIRNPVNCREYGAVFLPRPAAGPVRILYSGALKRAKGVLELLEAVRRFRPAFAGVRMVIIGDGPVYGECSRLVGEWQLDDIVELKGFVDEATKKRLLAESHIYCLPSHSEGMPISILEAMASGLPVVATTVGGIPYAIEQGRQGWLVPPGDVEALGRSLVSLIRSEPLRRGMGESGFERVRRLYDIRGVANEFMHRLNLLAEPMELYGTVVLG